MKSIFYLFFFVTTLLTHPTYAGTRDTSRYYLSLEIFGANSFYDIPSVEDYYKRKSSGLTYGMMLHWNLGHGFYAGIGYLSGSSSFRADTVGRGILGLDGLVRNIAYVDRLLLLGKDFTIIRNRLNLGLYAGTLKGNMLEGRQYTNDVVNYGPPKVVLYKAAAYTYHPFALMLGGRIGYQVSSRVKLNLYGFKRWFNPIDYITMDNYRGRDGEYIYRKWYGGLGLQYQFLYKPRTDAWLKGIKQKLKRPQQTGNVF